MSNEISYIDQDSIFTRKIETDSDICSSCYRKLREFLTPAEEMPDVVSDKVEYEPNAHFSYFDDKQETGRPSRKKSHCECGVVEWNRAKLRPLDSEQMMNAAVRISQRLTEKGVDHDEDVLLSHVEAEFDKPENQDREEKVFEEAVDEACSAIQTEERNKVIA